MRAALVIAIALVGGCITPSIPIPPPDPAKMTFDLDVDTGSAVFTYPPEANYVGSILYLYNRDLGTGLIQDANPDGSVGPTAPLAAELGHQVVVTFELEDQTVSTCIRLRDGAQSATDYCGF
jgi:hypothetical protein